MNSTPSSPPECSVSLEMLTHPYARLARFALIILLLIESSLLVLLAFEYRRKKLLLHGNLKLLYVHVTLSYVLNPVGFLSAEFRNMIVSMFFTGDPCAMRTPLWFALITREAAFCSSIAIPLLHLAIMLERFRATKLARSYEFEGRQFGRLIVLVVYFVTLAFGLVVAVCVLFDYQYDLNTQLVYNVITTEHSKNLIQIAFYLNICALLPTVIGDFYLYRKNKLLRNQESAFASVGWRYNLSEKYQQHENYLAMQLILPLDITYLVFMLLYYVIVNVIRSMAQAFFSDAVMLAHYNMANCLLVLYMNISLILYRRFLVHNDPGNHRKRASLFLNKVAPLEKSGQLYFEHLRKQWNYVPR